MYLLMELSEAGWSRSEELQSRKVAHNKNVLHYAWRDVLRLAGKQSQLENQYDYLLEAVVPIGYGSN